MYGETKVQSTKGNRKVQLKWINQNFKAIICVYIYIYVISKSYSPFHGLEYLRQQYTKYAWISHIHWSMVLLMKDVEVILPTFLVTRPLSLRQQQGDISVWQHRSHRSSIKTTIQRIPFIKHMGLAHRSKTQGHCKTRPLTWNVRNQHYNLDFNVLCNQFGVGIDSWVVLGIFHYRIY